MSAESGGILGPFKNVWNVAELRNRILYTIGMIFLIRLGVFVTLPGVDQEALGNWIEKSKEADDGMSGAMAMLNIFSGGGLQQCGIFALGIMPYISASIVMQLLNVIWPPFAKLSREDGGREKINQYTRILTIVIATVQGVLGAQLLQNAVGNYMFSGLEEPLVLNPGWQFTVMTTLTIVSGTLLLMWIGDQMTEGGIGNGTSIIITVNIISAFPGALAMAWTRFVTGEEADFGALILVLLTGFFLLVIAAVIAITESQRRIAVSYAKRIVGRKQMGGQTQYLPLKLNYAGVMPIIFASALLTLPMVFVQMIFRGDSQTANNVMEWFAPSHWFYYLFSAMMIFFFAFFWVATMFQPKQIAEDLKRNGGYIPGVRPGEPTAKFLDFTMTRLTFAGAIFLTAVFILPAIVAEWLNIPMLVTQFLGGTSLLIMVGVLLDVMRQVETYLLSQQYDGFFKQGKGANRTQRYAAAKTGEATSSQSSVGVLFTVIAALAILALVTTFMN